MKKILILFILLSFFYSCKKEINYQLTETIKKGVDTIFLQNDVILFISPDSIGISEMKKKLGEDDFYTIADDANFYYANAIDLLNTLKFKYTNIDNDKVIAYKFEGKTKIVPIEKSKWYSIFYKNGDYINSSLVDFKENYNLFFKRNDNTSKSISQILKENISSPENVINNLVFTKDNKGNLQINTKILEYISKNTTKENSSYLFALEGYEKKYRYSNRWSIDEFAKIRGYIFNTSYPLRRKYWLDKYKEWYNGEPEYIFGDSDSWRDNDYYGLPHLKEYVEDFIVKYW